MEQVTRLAGLAARAAGAHKGDYGHVLIVGGAVGMSGAVSLAGRAACRSGAGLVTIAAPRDSQPIAATLVPEAVTIPLPQRADGRIDPGPAAQVLERHAGRWTVLAAGCGWGTADESFAADSVALLRRTAELVNGPTVIDADGLNLLAQTGDLARRAWPSLVITPHPGELARLLGTTAAQIQADRHKAATEAIARLNGPGGSSVTLGASHHRPRPLSQRERGEARGPALPDEGLILLLKGQGTIVMDRRRYYVNATGNPGLACGGTGDVLTGLLAGLLAQGLARFDAAALAAHLHGLAGDLAADQLTQQALIAGDLVDFLPAAFQVMTQVGSN